MGIDHRDGKGKKTKKVIVTQHYFRLFIIMNLEIK